MKNDIIHVGITVNADFAHFINSNNPWFMRGSDMPTGLNAGVFALNNTNGQADSNVSFRIVDTIFKKRSNKKDL